MSKPTNKIIVPAISKVEETVDTFGQDILTKKLEKAYEDRASAVSALAQKKTASSSVDQEIVERALCLVHAAKTKQAAAEHIKDEAVLADSHGTQHNLHYRLRHRVRDERILAEHDAANPAKQASIASRLAGATSRVSGPGIFGKPLGAASDALARNSQGFKKFRTNYRSQRTRKRNQRAANQRAANQGPSFASRMGARYGGWRAAREAAQATAQAGDAVRSGIQQVTPQASRVVENFVANAGRRRSALTPGQLAGGAAVGGGAIGLMAGSGTRQKKQAGVRSWAQGAARDFVGGAKDAVPEGAMRGAKKQLGQEVAKTKPLLTDSAFQVGGGALAGLSRRQAAGATARGRNPFGLSDRGTTALAGGAGVAGVGAGVAAGRQRKKEAGLSDVIHRAGVNRLLRKNPNQLEEQAALDWLTSSPGRATHWAGQRGEQARGSAVKALSEEYEGLAGDIASSPLVVARRRVNNVVDRFANAGTEEPARRGLSAGQAAAILGGGGAIGLGAYGLGRSQSR